jgi:glycosyltransferase involved in cell wall biosynthesis
MAARRHRGGDDDEAPDRPMRIVHLADYGGPYAGSFIPMLRAAVVEAAGRGHASHVVLTPVAIDRPWLSQLASTPAVVGFARSTSGRDLRAAVRDCLPRDAQAVILHSSFTAFDMPAIRVARRRPGTRVIWHVQSRIASDVRIRVANSVKYGLFGRLVDEILCVAPDVEQAVRARLAPAARTALVPNAVDTARFVPAGAEDRRSARAALRVAPDVPVLLHFGWDWERKGGDLFADMLRRMRRTAAGAGVIGLTVGGGAEAEACARSLGLGSALRVLAPCDDVRALHACADVLVSCSRAEGMPFAVLEALSAGIPVVATDIPGQAAVLRERAGCRLVAAGDAGQLADAALALLGESPSRRVESARADRAWVRREADIRPWARSMVDRYERLAAG